MAFDLTALLGFANDQGASDLHISAGMPPMVRIRGEMVRLQFGNDELGELPHAGLVDLFAFERHEMLPRVERLA